MKKNQLLYFVCFVSVFSITASSAWKLNHPSKWTSADVKQFKKDCLGVKEVKDLGKLGVQICDCILEKSQLAYTSYASATTDEKGMEQIGEACGRTLAASMSGEKSSASMKGKWSGDDKKKFYDACMGVKEVKDLGKTGKQLCDCMFVKAEMRFDNFKECDSDEATDEEIARECVKEIQK
ncbi:MAG: hypothetical protein ACJ75J_07805 [Cytophagaceae bacterium]